MPIRPIRSTSVRTPAEPVGQQQAAAYPNTVETPPESDLMDVADTDADELEALLEDTSTPALTNEEDEELDSRLEDFVLSYLNLVPNPTDEQFHLLADAAGLDHALLEETVYSLLAENVEKEEEDLDEEEPEVPEESDDSEEDDDELIPTSL